MRETPKPNQRSASTTIAAQANQAISFEATIFDNHAESIRFKVINV
jgi:hypothetical protein